MQEINYENGKWGLLSLVNGQCKKFECKWWIQVRGNDPQTGQEIDEWDCTAHFYPC